MFNNIVTLFPTETTDIDKMNIQTYACWLISLFQQLNSIGSKCIDVEIQDHENGQKSDSIKPLCYPLTTNHRIFVFTYTMFGIT